MVTMAGTGLARSCTMSHLPDSQKRSIRASATCRTNGRHGSAAAGENFGLSSWRYLVKRGGSTSSGISCMGACGIAAP